MVASRCSESDSTTGLSASGLCAKLGNVRLQLYNRKMQECVRKEIEELAREGISIVVLETDLSLNFDWDSDEMDGFIEEDDSEVLDDGARE